MAYYFPNLPKSTYAMSYTHARPNRFKCKYSEIPSLVDQPELVQPPRMFPIEPYGPNRLNPLGQAPAAGLGSKGVSHRTPDPHKLAEVMAAQGRKRTETEEKETAGPTILGLPVISGGYFQLPIHPNLDRSTAEKIFKERIFKSTAQRTMDECAIPTRKVVAPSTTIEERPDMIRVSPEMYEPSVCEWQRVPLWDKIQPRRLLHPHGPNPALERAKNIREQKQREAKELDERITKQIRSLIASDKLSSLHTLQHGGYMGFIPRCPTGEPMERPAERADMATVSQASHRKFPSCEYHPQQYGRNAPMSTQLTLTYPYNPFNKIEEDTEFVALPT